MLIVNRIHSETKIDLLFVSFFVKIKSTVLLEQVNSFGQSDDLKYKIKRLNRKIYLRQQK